MMPKVTVVLNDYGSSLKLYINYNEAEILKVRSLWDKTDQRLIDLHCLDAFAGYTKWSELTVSHYRFLICRGLTILADMDATERADILDQNVDMTNFLILAFIFRIENDTQSEIEQFRINRFNEHCVTFDYSASFEITYDRPRGKKNIDSHVLDSDPTFSVVNFNPTGEATNVPVNFSIVDPDDKPR